MPLFSIPSLKSVVQIASAPQVDCPSGLYPASLCRARESSIGTRLPSNAGIYMLPPPSQLVIIERVLMSSA